MDPTDPRAPTELSPTHDEATAASRAPAPELPRSSRYQVGGPLGQGGMGEILVARDTHLGRDVAIKRLRSATPSAEAVARFVREARIQGRLQHPAIVPIHDLALDEGGRPFFAMKQLAGTTLHDLLVAGAGAPASAAASLGPAVTWTRPRLLRAFVEVCLAIELAHTRGVVHRDLKPTNIALGDFGEVYVLDWGVARILGESAPGAGSVTVDDDRAARADAVTIDDGATGPGAILGTPGYMAPEQLRGEPELGPAADIYALGCVLFELLAGEPLHPRAPQAAIASTLAEGEHRPSARAPGRDVSPELDEICARATAADPAARYLSARALGDAVQRYLDGDRDLALRRRLAAGHLADARAALARGDDDVDRRAAMRAAGRALALAPDSEEAAGLVSQLLLTPPRAVPREVDERLAALDVAAARDHARAGAIAVAAFLAAFPLFFLIGVKDAATLGATFVVGVVHLGSLVATVRSPRPARFLWLSIGAYALLVALLGRFFNPFVLATGLAVLGAALAGAHPSLRRIGLVLVLYVGSVLVPWLLELVGVISPTYWLRGEEVVIVPPVLVTSRPAGELAIAAYVVGVIAMCGALAWRLSQRQRAARDQLELQAWHLRQLVPATAAPAPAPPPR